MEDQSDLGRARLLGRAIECSPEAPELFLSAWALPELVEASARSQNAAAARAALDRLADAAAAGETDWVRGVEARSRALLNEDDVAERCYQEAIERIQSTELRSELAQAQVAYDSFAALEMGSFAERAHRELVATGEKARRRTVEWHLRKVFSKLGISSRRTLPEAMASRVTGALAR